MGYDCESLTSVLEESVRTPVSLIIPCHLDNGFSIKSERLETHTRSGFVCKTAIPEYICPYLYLLFIYQKQSLAVFFGGALLWLE